MSESPFSNNQTPSAVTSQLGPLLEMVRDAFQAELPKAKEMLASRGWEHRSDPHLFPQLLRRGMMEQIKALDPRMESDDNLGIPMSGLIMNQRSEEGDLVFTLRIYKAADGGCPPMTSAPRKDFCRQHRSAQGRLWIGDPEGPEAEACNLILIWDTTDGETLSVFSLLRPWDVTPQGEALIDWRVDLMSMEHALEDDLEFTRPDEDEQRDADALAGE